MGLNAGAAYPDPTTASLLYSYGAGPSSVMNPASAYGQQPVATFPPPTNTDFGLGRQMGMMWDPMSASYVFPPSVYAMTPPQGVMEIQQVGELNSLSLSFSLSLSLSLFLFDIVIKLVAFG